MRVHELGHIVLYVRNLERSRHFYGQLLGWKEIGHKPSAMAAFSSGRTHHELLLIQADPKAPASPKGSRIGLYHFGLKVGTTDDELREVLAKLEGADVPITGMSDHGVTHSLYVEDPDGNELELYIDVQPEKWREDPQAVLGPIKRLKL